MSKVSFFLIIPTLVQGGAERVMSELANELSRRSYAVTVVLLAKSNIFYQLNDDVRLINLGFENRNRLQRSFSQIVTFRKLRKLFKAERPDFTLSFMVKYNILTILASRFLGLKVFVSDRSNPKRVLSRWKEYLRCLTYPWATGVIAQTELAKSVMTSRINNLQNIRVIYNPVKVLNNSPENRRDDIILNVGRLVPEKGQEYLIKAFANLSESHWKLYILGDGELRQDLIALIDELGVGSKVFLPGAVTNVDHWLFRASIFAFPSISEGFPNALIEAMSAGLPCVSFDCDAGPREIIDHGINGFLIPVAAVDSLTQTLNKMIVETELRERIGEKASHVKEKYGLPSIVDQYLDFFESV